MKIDNQTLLLLNAYHDGELSPGEVLSMQDRIENEPELAAMMRRLANLSSDLTDALPGGPVPDNLRSTVIASLSLDVTGDDGATDERIDENASMLGANSRAATPWRSMAASLVIGLAAGGLGGSYVMHLSQEEQQVSAIESEILAAHLRGLIAPQPFDIASSQSHVVKPWFNGKTTIAPTAPDFSAQGFPLVGGRVDVISGQVVPTMVFKRRQHTISVTVTTSNGMAANASSVADGTNVRRWTVGDLTYWAVSDLNPAELSSFAALYEKTLSGSQ